MPIKNKPISLYIFLTFVSTVILVISFVFGYTYKVTVRAADKIDALEQKYHNIDISIAEIQKDIEYIKERVDSIKQGLENNKIIN